MKRLVISVGLFSLATGSATMAQAGASAATAPIAPQTTATATVLPSQPDTMIHVGTPISLKLMEEVTTKEKRARVGQRINLQVSEAIELAGHVVIPVGTPAVGEVTEVRYKGMWGKSGHVSAQVLYLRLGSRQIRISGAFDEKGTTGTAGVVASIALVPLAGFFVTGTSADLPVGMPVKAFIDEDLPVAFTGPAAPAPLAVP
eukprot:gene16924-17111_t